MNVTPDTTVLDYARALARESGLTVVIDKSVARGEILIDDKAGTVSVCPCASRHTLRMNANTLLPPNR